MPSSQNIWRPPAFPLEARRIREACGRIRATLTGDPPTRVSTPNIKVAGNVEGVHAQDSDGDVENP
ncbi:hypothetical protein GCM10012280_40270 [Wenjunlia tyrosinilytica]|uniref:Uncharacterized protein n=1 Tax=Wenjunlia tyrosinilytica TaxID=1544741 RepID=A0A917ZU11_9ACTN|nr:hypothetical protein GCM10012280_40270 [Wenjunlia tyrosinilytica]